MGACILNGIGAGPSETIMPEVIADIVFLHDRGKWNTLYWVILNGALMIGPIVAGAMTERVGWRSFWWLNAGMLAVSFLMVIFMFPETRFKRALPGTMNHKKPSSPEEKTCATTHEDINRVDAEKENDVNRINTASSIIPNGTGLELSETAARDPYLGRGKPSKWQWKIFQSNSHPFRSIFYDLWIPFKLLTFPIVEFAAFVVSWSLSSFLTINLTQSQVLAAPPYHFTPLAVGFTNFALLVGALVGLFTAGPLSDWVSARSTKRNKGIREPEMRLPAMMPYVFIMFIGNIVVSVGYEKKWPWEAIIIVGYTCAGIQVAALPGIVSTYAVDSYKPVAGSLFVAITINKNL